MPTYDRKYCIDQAIQSVLFQNYDNFELLIVDDCSMDGTSDHIKATYREEIEEGKIRLIVIGKTGCSGARNVGLSNAKNNWICYLDTDNKMMPHYFEIFNRGIHENPGYECFYAKIRICNSREVVGNPFSFFDLLHANFIDVGSFVHSNAIYQKLGGFDVNLTSLEDWELAIRYTALYEPYFIDSIVLGYNDTRGGDRTSEIEKHDDNTKKIMAKNILVNVNFLKNSLYPLGFPKWALDHLFKVFSDRIRKIF